MEKIAIVECYIYFNNHNNFEKLNNIRHSLLNTLSLIVKIF